APQVDHMEPKAHLPEVSGGETGGERTPESGRRETIRSTLNAELTRGPDRVIMGEWAGGIPEEMATLPQLRLGRRWYSFRRTFGVVVAVALPAFVGGIFLARYLRTFPVVQTFIANHPGTGAFAPAVTTGFPWWLRYQH